MKRVLWDTLLSIVIAACLIGLQNWNWRPPLRDFVASYHPIIWGLFNGVLFLVVSIFVWNGLNRPQAVLPRIIDILGILILAHSLALAFYFIKNPAEDVWTVIGFTTLFNILPALTASIASCLLIYCFGWMNSKGLG